MIPGAKWALLIALGSFCSFFLYSCGWDPRQLQILLEWIRSLGWMAPLILAATHVCSVALCFPGTMLFELFSGFLFGWLWGSMLIGFSKSLGGTLAFCLGKTLLRNWVEMKLETSTTFQKLHFSMKEDGWRFALMLRLSPIPSWVINYGLSLSPISFSDFFIATFLGSLPMIIQNVYFGSVLKDFTDPTPAPSARSGSLLIGACMAIGTALFTKYLYKYVTVINQSHLANFDQRIIYS